MTAHTHAATWVWFDAGGTLFDLLTLQPAFGAALATRGLAAPWDRLVQAIQEARQQLWPADHVGPPPDFRIDQRRARTRRERFVEALLQALRVPDTARESARAAIQAALVAPGLFAPYPDAVPNLRALRSAGVRLGILSNWDAGLPLLCQYHGLDAYFEVTLASEAVGYAKPSRRLFLEALARGGAVAERSYYVGDSLEEDVHGATAAGLRAILLDRGGYYPAGSWELTIRTLDGLPSIIEEHRHAYSH